MTTPDTGYVPIDCEFHDRLEALATLRKVAHVQFRTPSGELQSRDALITDMYASKGAEYLVLGTGDVVRFDRLVEVDGVALPATAACAVPQ